MANNNVLRWLDGRGWLILSGGDSSDVRAQALGRAAADGGVAYVDLGGQIGSGESALADMEDLGAPSGYLVNVMTEDDQTIHSKLADAGVVVVAGGSDVSELRSSLMGAAAAGIQTAFENGAVVLVEGQAAMLAGAWVLTEDDRLLGGLEWVENALIVPGLTSAEESAQVQTILTAQPAALGISVGAGSALALGPDGEVETWGQKQVTIALGPNYGV